MKKAQVRQLLREALTKLEEARQGMVGFGNDFTADDVHHVALSQYEVGKAIEWLETDKPAKRTRR